MIRIKSVVQGLDKRSVLISAMLPGFDFEILIKVTRSKDKQIAIEWSGNDYNQAIFEHRELIGRSVAAWLGN